MLPAEDSIDAFRRDRLVILNCYGEEYELTPAEADELGTQLLYAAARIKEAK